MSNTISLLESIGKNASLRYMASPLLMQALSSEASDAFRGAVESGNRSPLFAELGDIAKQKQITSDGWPSPPQSTNFIWRNSMVDVTATD